MTFQEWLDEIEGPSGPRFYRLVDDLPDGDSVERMLVWLEAAFQVGYEQGRNDFI
jgi:hypothetical protein